MTVLLAATGDAVVRMEADGSGRAEASLDGSGAQCVASHPRRPDAVFAGCRGGGLWRSHDGGRSWQDSGLPASDVFSVAISPVTGAVYAGCEPSMVFVSPDGAGRWRELESLRSIPSAPTWSFPPRPWTSHVRWIAPSAHDTSLLLVGIELGGVMRSEDGGSTWQDHRPGAKRDAHALAWHPRKQERAYEAAGDGSAWSHDAGETWEATDAGRDRHYVWALAVDPLDPDTWFVSAARSASQAHGGGRGNGVLYRWRGSGPWEPVGGAPRGPLDTLPYALLLTPERDLVAATRDGRLYASADLGDSWRAVPVAGAPPRRVLSLAVAYGASA